MEPKVSKNWDEPVETTPVQTPPVQIAGWEGMGCMYLCIEQSVSKYELNANDSCSFGRLRFAAVLAWYFSTSCHEDWKEYEGCTHGTQMHMLDIRRKRHVPWQTTSFVSTLVVCSGCCAFSNVGASRCVNIPITRAPAWRNQLPPEQEAEQRVSFRSRGPNTQVQIAHEEVSRLRCNQPKAPCAWGRWAETRKLRRWHVDTKHPSKSRPSSFRWEACPNPSSIVWQTAWPEILMKAGMLSQLFWIIIFFKAGVVWQGIPFWRKGKIWVSRKNSN